MSYLILCCGEDNEIEIREFKDPFRLLERMGVEKFYNSVKFSLCIVSQDNELLVCCIANLIYVYKLTVANIYSSRQILRGHFGKIEFCQEPMWLHITLYFCRRGREGQRNLKKGSFVFLQDKNGKRYATMAHDEASDGLLILQVIKRKSVSYFLWR